MRSRRLLHARRTKQAPDDAWAALKELADHGDRLGIDACRIAIGANSAAGVPVALDLVRGMTHDFIKMGRVLKEAGAARQFAAEALKQAWSSSP